MDQVSTTKGEEQSWYPSPRAPNKAKNLKPGVETSSDHLPLIGKARQAQEVS